MTPLSPLTDEQIDALEARIDRLRWQDGVQIYGAFDPDTVATLLAQARRANPSRDTLLIELTKDSWYSEAPNGERVLVVDVVDAIDTILELLGATKDETL